MLRDRIVIDRVIVETRKERADAARIAPVLRVAFQRLQERLERSPFGGGRIDAHEVIERLELGTLSADDLLGPRGAERLADELYRRLTRRRT